MQESITTLCPDSLCAADAGDDQDGDADAGQFALTDGSFRSLMTDAVVVHAHATMPPVVRDRFPAIDSQWGGFAGQTRRTEDAEPTDLEASLPLPPTEERRTWVDQMLAMIGDFDGSARTSMHYAHLVAPHIPWQVNPSGTRYDRPEALSTSVTGVENGFWLDDPRLATQGYQRHLMQLGFVDRLLGAHDRRARADRDVGRLDRHRAGRSRRVVRSRRPPPLDHADQPRRALPGAVLHPRARTGRR